MMRQGMTDPTTSKCSGIPEWRQGALSFGVRVHFHTKQSIRAYDIFHRIAWPFITCLPDKLGEGECFSRFFSGVAIYRAVIGHTFFQHYAVPIQGDRRYAWTTGDRHRIRGYAGKAGGRERGCAADRYGDDEYFRGEI